MASCVVVGSIFLAGDDLLGVVQLTVSASSDFVANTGLQINKHSAGDMLAGASLREEGVEGIITTAHSLVGWHLAVGLDAVFQAVKLPAGISSLDASLADVD